MNRITFLKRLGLGAVALAVAPFVVAKPKELVPVEEFKGTDGLFTQIEKINKNREFTVYGDQHQIKEFNKLIVDYNNNPSDWTKNYSKPIKSQIVIGNKIVYGNYK